MPRQNYQLQEDLFLSLPVPPHDDVDALPEEPHSELEEVPQEDALLLPPPLPTTCVLHACSKVDAMEEFPVVRSLEMEFHVLVRVDILSKEEMLVVACKGVNVEC